MGRIKIVLLFSFFLIFLDPKKTLHAHKRNTPNTEEITLDLDCEHPQYLYSDPEVTYEVVENPFYKLFENTNAEHPKYLYSNPKVHYHIRKNPLYNLKGVEVVQKRPFQTGNCTDPLYEEIKCDLQRESQYLRRLIDCRTEQVCQLQQQPYCCPQDIECCDQVEECCYLPRSSHPLFPSGYEFYAAALYWSPTFGGIQYATLAPQPNEPQVVTPGYGWGYKVEAFLYFNYDQIYLRGDYYFFKHGSSDSVSSPGNIIPVFSPVLGDNFDFASCDLESKYHGAGISCGYQWFSTPYLKSNVFAGARYIRLKEVFIPRSGRIRPCIPAFFIKCLGTKTCR